MANPFRWIGGHVTLTEEIPSDYVFQCFLTNSHGHFAPSREKHWSEAGIHFKGGPPRLAHSSYVTFPWSEKAETEEKSMKDIEIASRCVNIIGLWGLVVHLPKEFHLLPGFEGRVRECFKRLQPPCVLLFENSGSSSLLVSEGRLPALPIHRMKACQEVIGKVASSFKDREWGFCFDTAHAFIQGQPLTSSADVGRFLDEAKGVNIRALHFNGSMHPFRSGRDQHAAIASSIDYIWGNDSSGVRTLLEWIGKRELPSILERPGQGTPAEYDGEIARLKKIAAKKSKISSETMDYSFEAARRASLAEEIASKWLAS